MANNSESGAADASKSEAPKTESSSKADVPEKKSFWTHEHIIEMLKVAATLWVAGIGTFVTMEFNERQHELNRIEAIAKMLPHLNDAANTVSVPATTPATTTAGTTTSTPAADPGATRKLIVAQRRSTMSRDGAIWAIYRTANNRTMLRDLASLFPEDIYRVISSTAEGGALGSDEDAVTALEVASEKLAAKFSAEKRTDLALRLYQQVLRLKQRTPGDTTPLHIVDVTDAEIQDQPVTDETALLIASVNKLGDLHMQDSASSKEINTHHFQAKQLYKRARDLGKGSTDPNVKAQVAIADVDLGIIFTKEERYEQAREYYREARALQVAVFGADSTAVRQTDKAISDLTEKIDQRRVTVPDQK